MYRLYIYLTSNTLRNQITFCQVTSKIMHYF